MVVHAKITSHMSININLYSLCLIWTLFWFLMYLFFILFLFLIFSINFIISTWVIFYLNFYQKDFLSNYFIIIIFLSTLFFPYGFLSLSLISSLSRLSFFFFTLPEFGWKMIQELKIKFLKNIKKRNRIKNIYIKNQHKIQNQHQELY